MIYARNECTRCINNANGRITQPQRAKAHNICGGAHLTAPQVQIIKLHIGIATFLHLVAFPVELDSDRGWTNFGWNAIRF